MDLQAEKLQLVKMVIDTEDRSLIRDLITLFKSRSKAESENVEAFYDGFREAVHEIKLAKEGKIKPLSLKDALNEL
ncbi:hypothetical protein [Pararcticibacter amylolyticus]|uniref:Uncharacterized protein n=1 Tax=Pararcticibacter amylolyticus TaxID=2173175 RepID=A0A2U2PLQ7_9SPHI|nr:hypothetical protein [Pararcticibacter amylolyticus]PWG82109.1 hypothetical protein DDR33_03585 [Pararcticibacter amylolyticus]